MSFSNYAGLKAAVAAWLNRDDLSDAIVDFITAAEATLNRVLRVRQMVAQAMVSVAAGDDRGVLPDDCLDVQYAADANDASVTLAERPAAWVAAQRRLRMAAAGTPLYFAIVGNELRLCPPSSAARTYDISYFQEIPELSDAQPVNWLLAHHPDLYLHAALMHAYPYLADDERAASSAARVATLVQGLTGAADISQGYQAQGYQAQGVQAQGVQAQGGQA